MKRLITFLIAILITGALSAQTNQMRYPLYMGITATPPATGGSIYLRGATSGAALLKVPAVAGSNIIFQFPSVQASGVSVLTNDGAGVTSWTSTVDNATIYAKLLPDSVQKTSDFTLSLTEANRLVTVTAAGKVAVLIPLNSSVAIPIGTTINFFQGGAGPIKFRKASGVVLRSKKDSTEVNAIWGWASLYKRGANNWLLYGDIID